MPAPGHEIGRINRERVRAYLRENVGAENQECARALGLSLQAVGRHIAKLRAERES